MTEILPSPPPVEALAGAESLNVAAQTGARVAGIESAILGVGIPLVGIAMGIFVFKRGLEGIFLAKNPLRGIGKEK